MLTYALMGLLVLGLAITTLWGVKYQPEKESFMSIEDTTFLRGFWCIIVVLVHVPELYQNRIQDMLGSFAYIGVTFFFMTSAYGLKWSMEHKPGYMDCFWRRRLPPILIPALIANAIGVMARYISGEAITALSFLNINNWVKVLLLYYFLFWLVYSIVPRLLGSGKWQDIIMCSIVLIFSLIDYFTSLKITSIWIVEPLGFAYGILAAKYSESILAFLNKKWKPKIICFAILSFILGIVYLKFKPVFFFGDYILKILLGLSITTFMYELICKIKVGNKANSFLGEVSYEVYILHGAVFAILSGIKIEWNSSAFIYVALLMTLLSAWLLKLLCKPIIKKIR